MLIDKNMTIIDQIALNIIKEQELIIGPLAWIEAKKVAGIKVIDQKQGQLDLENGEPNQIIDRLVAQYDRLFGRASHEVSKEAAAPFLVNLASSEMPSSLK